MHRPSLRVVAALALAFAAVTVTPTIAGAQRSPHHRHHHAAVRPVIFVHGFTGSGAQFETQAQRFTSNGYPARDIALHEYDSTFSVETRDDVFTGLDALIARLRKETHAGKVDLAGHSLGTSLMQQYLNSTPARAGAVAHYVNLDGAPATAPPGGVSTLAIWGSGSTARQITGAQNVYLSDQTHVQVVTSPETFRLMYRFFTGHEPKTTAVLPARGRRIVLAGRAMDFPQNTGVPNAFVQIWRVNGATGARLCHHPDATFTLAPDGSWGPFLGRRGVHYEFTIVRPGVGSHHFYDEPFVRSDLWIRLLTSPPDAGIGSLVERGTHHAAITIIRYKEWWGDQGADNDRLAINGQNIVNAANSPRTKLVNAYLVFDAGSDGVSHIATPIPALAALPFLTGVDLFMPATTPPDHTISVAATPRLGGGATQVINVPNWASATDVISVQFHEYVP
jgi:pimeloyl-ACP methyl ester carboxylesterase